MRLDLRKHNCTDLTFSGELSTHKKELNNFLKSVKKRTGEEVFGQKYSIKRQSYLASASVTDAKKGKEIWFNYSSSETTLPQKIEPVSALLKYLSKFKDEMTFLVWAEFSYPRNRFEDILSLPISLEKAAVPFDEIQGIRLVKKENDRILHSVGISLIDEDIFELVSFKYVSEFNDKLPAEILAHATEISSQTVKQLRQK